MMARILVFMLGIISAITMLPDCARAALTVKANHDRIPINFFYHGSTVTISGEADAGADLIIKITSEGGKDEAFRKKGKVAGLLWMNTGQVKFTHAPHLYFVDSTKEPGQMCPAGELESNDIGYGALKKQIGISPPDTDGESGRWLGEFIKYKEHEKLYCQSSGNIRVTPGEGGPQTYFLTLDWPYQAPPGRYYVDVYAVKGGKVADRARTEVLVEQVGAVKLISGMAKNNAALYGALSVLIAMAAGVGVGLIFRKGGGAH